MRKKWENGGEKPMDKCGLWKINDGEKITIF